MDALKTSNRTIPCALLCVLGFLGNWFNLELFFNVDFLIGSFFVMLSIMALGGAYGAIAGFVAGTCTYLIWNHPWAIFIFTGEALFVASLYARRKGNPVIYDIFYWACIGMPMVYLFYHHFMGMQLQGTLVVMLKQSVNGVFNALMAALAYILFRLTKRSTEARVAYSQLLFVAMVSLVLLPSMLLLITGMRNYQEKRTGELESRVSFVSKAARKTLADWIGEHHKKVQLLATLVGDPGTSTFEDMQHYVELIKTATPAFKKMGVINKSSITVSYSPLVEDGKSTLGVNFSDRPYISIMKKEKKPYIPDVVMGKLGNPSLIVLLLAPIIVSGEYGGYCTGVLETTQVSGILANLVERDINITITDGGNRVIASTIPDLKTMDMFQRPYIRNGEMTDSKTLLWKPDPRPNTSLMQQWRSSFLYNAAPLSDRYRWKVIVEASCLPLTEDISRYSLSRLTLLGLLILSTVAVSHLLSNGFISSIVKLQTLTKSLPQRLDNVAEIVWPKSSIEELAELSSNFQDMASALLSDITKRKRAEEALRESRTKLEAALAGMADAVFISDMQGQFIEFNDAFATFHRFRSREECSRTFAEYPDILDVFMSNGELAPLSMWAVPRALRGETALNAEYSLRRKDTGETWDGSYTFAPIRDKDGMIVGSVVVARDITERKKADKALRDSLEEKTALLKEVHHRVKNNLQIVASLLGLQAARLDNPQVLDVLQDTRNRVKSMALLHETLYRSGNLARINFATYLKDLCGQLLLSSGSVTGRVRLEYHIARIELPLELAVPCGLIVSELVSNALKHGFPGKHTGRVVVGLEPAEGQTLALSVRDEGVGLPSDFNPASTSTLGMQLVSGLAGQLGGQWEVDGAQDTGAAFRIIFPVPKDTLLEGES